jgi:hypothetical protein
VTVIIKPKKNDLHFLLCDPNIVFFLRFSYNFWYLLSISFQCSNVIKKPKLNETNTICTEAQNLLECTAVFLTECRPTFQLRTRQHIPEDSELHTRCRENLKSHTICTVFLQHGFVLLENSTLEIQPVVMEALISTDQGAPHIVRRGPIPYTAAGNAVKSVHL